MKVKGNAGKMKPRWSDLRKWARSWATLPARAKAYREDLEQHNKVRAEFNDLAVSLGYAGWDYLESAVEIARRCQGAELALKKLAEANERELASTEQTAAVTNAEIERLAWLAESCGATVHAIAKVMRHGFENASPYGGPINQVALERELGDVRAAMQMMETAGDVRGGDIKHWQHKKAISVHKWMHNQ